MENDLLGMPIFGRNVNVQFQGFRLEDLNGILQYLISPFGFLDLGRPDDDWVRHFFSSLGSVGRDFNSEVVHFDVPSEVGRPTVTLSTVLTDVLDPLMDVSVLAEVVGTSEGFTTSGFWAWK